MISLIALCLTLPIMIAVPLLKLAASLLRATRDAVSRQRHAPMHRQLADVDFMIGTDFERYVAHLMRCQGFKRIAVTPSTGDHGVDITASRSGVRYAVQVKRQARPVSRRAVSDAVAGIRVYDCSRAMVVTNNYFTRGAMLVAQSNGCTVVDRTLLAEWIREADQARIRKPDDIPPWLWKLVIVAFVAGYFSVLILLSD